MSSLFRPTESWITIFQAYIYPDMASVQPRLVQYRTSRLSVLDIAASHHESWS